MPTALIDVLDYHRTSFASGEIWRVFTAHIFHTNSTHLALNLGGLLLLWALHGEKYTPRIITANYAVAALIITLGIHLFSPDIIRYVGLSGMLHGLFIWGACDDIRLGRKSGYLMIIGAIAKVASEQIWGPDAGLAESIGASVAIDAHLFGIVSGALAFALTKAGKLH